VSGAPSYRRLFWRSPHHWWLFLLTAGLGFAFSWKLPLLLVLGLTAYVLGLIYLPDTGFFRAWVDAHLARRETMARREEADSLQERRQRTLADLSPPARRRYADLAGICREIVSAGGGGEDDPRLGRLDDLLWTYLRLLSLEESLDRFLAAERREDIPGKLQTAREDAEALGAEVEELRQAGKESLAEARLKLMDSRNELARVLEKRLARVEEARANLDLVTAEEERLEEQVKLVRADSVAIRDAEGLSARMDAAVEMIGQTNRWLGELDRFRELVEESPRDGVRQGAGGAGEASGSPPARSRARAGTR
jgi:hypothetical protein